MNCSHVCEMLIVYRGPNVSGIVLLCKSHNLHTVTFRQNIVQRGLNNEFLPLMQFVKMHKFYNKQKKNKWVIVLDPLIAFSTVTIRWLKFHQGSFSYNC